MTRDIEDAEEMESKFENAVEAEPVSDQPEGTGDSTSLKKKLKKDFSSRKKLEEKLEEARVNRQVRDFDFDDFDE